MPPFVTIRARASAPRPAQGAGQQPLVVPELAFVAPVGVGGVEDRHARLGSGGDRLERASSSRLSSVEQAHAAEADPKLRRVEPPGLHAAYPSCQRAISSSAPALVRSRWIGVTAILPSRDRAEVGVGLVVVGRVVAVDAVAAAARLVGLELEPVAVDAPAEPGHLDPLHRRRRRVHVQDRPGGQAALGDHAGPAWPGCRRAGEKSYRRWRRKWRPASLRLLRDGDGGDAEHDPLERGGDRARVRDVVAQVHAVVDAGDDQVGALADEPELGEAHAVDGRAVGGEAARPVAQLDLGHGQRPGRS